VPLQTGLNPDRLSDINVSVHMGYGAGVLENDGRPGFGGMVDGQLDGSGVLRSALAPPTNGISRAAIPEFPAAARGPVACAVSATAENEMRAAGAI
jgi:hypothetical protein